MSTNATNIAEVGRAVKDRSTHDLTTWALARDGRFTWAEFSDAARQRGLDPFDEVLQLRLRYAGVDLYHCLNTFAVSARSS